MSNTVEIVVQGKNEATKIFRQVAGDATSAAQDTEQAWTKAMAGVDSSIQRGGLGATEAGGGFNRLKDSAKGAGDEVERMGARSEDSSERLRRVGEASDEVDTKAMGFRDTITGVQDTMKGLSDTSLSTGDRLLTLGMGIGDLGSAGYNLIVPAFEKIKSVFAATGEGASGLAGKLGLIGTSLAGGAALGGVIAGATILVSAWANEQANAAKYVQTHKDNVTALTAAIAADKGVLGDNVQAVNLKSLADKNATANLAAFGANLGQAKLAIEGNTDAQRRLTQSARDGLATIADHAQITGTDRDALLGLADQSMKTGKSMAELLHDGQRGAEVASNLGGEWNSAAAAIVNGTGAVGDQVRVQREAQDAYYQAQEALSGLSRAQLEARDATAEHTTAIYDQVNASLGLRGAQESSKEALDAYNTALKSGKEDEKASALLRLEQAWQSELSAVQKSTEEHSAATTQESRHAEGLAAMNARAVELANTFQGSLPASLQETIGRMSVTEARAAGVTVAIDGTGRAVYRLPDGRFINIQTNAGQEAGKVAYLRDQINALRNREITIAVNTFYGTAGRGASLTGPAIARATGGPIGHAAEGGGRSGLTLVGENGPELVKLPTGSFVNPSGSAGGGGGGSADVRVTIDLSGGGDALLEWFKNRIRIDGGNVQTVMGVN